jgi:hypothetical protein
MAAEIAAVSSRKYDELQNEMAEVDVEVDVSMKTLSDSGTSKQWTTIRTKRLSLGRAGRARRSKQRPSILRGLLRVRAPLVPVAP